jgi:hypothetical protein
MSSTEWSTVNGEWSGCRSDCVKFLFDGSKVHIGYEHEWETVSFDEILEIAEKIREIRNEK